MGNSCMTVFSNTSSWEQQELNQTKKQKERRKVRMDQSKTDMEEKVLQTIYSLGLLGTTLQSSE